MSQTHLNNDDDIPEGTDGAEGNESSITDPFNPADIDINTKAEVISQLMTRIERGYTKDTSASICLVPSFQRKGNLWTPDKQSRLIESILLGIPLPMFYVAANREGDWDVVDGIQRLGILRDFVLGESYLDSVKKCKTDIALKGQGFALHQLEFLTQFEGKPFAELPGKQQDDINGCNVQVTVIRPGTPEAVKFNIFKRINTGGMALTGQEIRHALHQGAATEFLKTLVELPEFSEATAGSMKDQRMEGRELILRMLAVLVLGYKQKSGKIDMDTILNSTMRILNILGKTPEKTKEPLPSYTLYELDVLKDIFTRGMQRCTQLFGNYAFRNCLPPDRRRPINKALFETWGTQLALMQEEHWGEIFMKKEIFLKKYKEILTSDVFQKTISHNSYLSAAIVHRYEVIETLIQKLE